MSYEYLWISDSRTHMYGHVPDEVNGAFHTRISHQNFVPTVYENIQVQN